MPINPAQDIQEGRMSALEPHVHGLEFAIALLRDIKRMCPEVLRHADIDAAIMNELNPALVSARAAVRARQAVLNAREEAGQPVAGMAQGQCETTSTPRFWIPNCECGTYENNLGPCMTWEEGGAVGRCVYCDHDLTCHRKLSAIYAAPPAALEAKHIEVDAANIVFERMRLACVTANSALAGEQDQPKGGDANGAIDADTGTLETADAVKGAAHPDNADAICEADRILSSLRSELFADMVEAGIADDTARQVLDRAFYHAAPGTRLDALLIRLHDPTARVLR